MMGSANPHKERMKRKREKQPKCCSKYKGCKECINFKKCGGVKFGKDKRDETY